MDFDNELARVDWHELKHAYGTADSTPNWIRELRSSLKEDRQKAIQQLDVSIHHQGGVYSASLAAVPFLLELVNDSSVQDRQDVILLLLGLAMGFPPEWLPKGFDLNTWTEYAQRAFGSSEYVALWVQMYHAVREGVPIFQRLMADPDVTLRIAAGYALAWFKEDAPASAPFVTNALAHAADDSEVCNHILALGLLNGYLNSKQDTTVFQVYQGNSYATAVRTCAAIALANTVPESVDDEKIELLVEALDNLEPPPVFYWNWGDLDSYAALALGPLIEYGPERVVPGLCDALRRSPPGPVLAISQALCRALFPGGLSPDPGFASLNGHQQMFLMALVKTWEEVYGSDFIYPNFTELLKGYGLPDRLEKMKAYISGGTINYDGL